jgi:hypothetical protein
VLQLAFEQVTPLISIRDQLAYVNYSLTLKNNSSSYTTGIKQSSRNIFLSLKCNTMEMYMLRYPRCNMDRGEEEYVRILVGKPERKRPLEGTRCS